MLDRPRALVAVASLVLAAGCAPDPTPADGDAVTDAAAETPADAPTEAAGEPGFDYPGSWLDDGRCVDICGVTPESPVERPAAVRCFDDDPDCLQKTGDGDYDYLMVSKHWLPTMCFGLDAGYDTTLTHQRGDRCVPEAPTRLTLHGLWPNYFNGFPQCCGGGLPLDAVAMAAWPEELRDRLWRAQPDPTVDSFRPALCEIYNHEWQKHGTCFQDTGDIDADARAYFELGLDLFERVADANAQVDAWAGQEQPRAAVEALYPKAIQVLCDRHQPGRLLEIRSCWTRGGEPTDCSPTDGFGPAVSCGDTVELPVWTG